MSSSGQTQWGRTKNSIGVSAFSKPVASARYRRILHGGRHRVDIGRWIEQQMQARAESLHHAFNAAGAEIGYCSQN